MYDNIVNGYIEQWIVQKIIDKMYEVDDQMVLQAMFQEIMNHRNTNPSLQKKLEQGLLNAVFKKQKLTREEQAQHQQQQQKPEKLLYTDFLKCILDFQYSEHIKFLSNFLDIFKSIDLGKHGIINEEQFNGLL